MKSFKTFVLAALTLLALSGTAHANGASVTMQNGDLQNGTVTTTGVDDYYLYVPAGHYLKASITDTGGDATFYPQIQLFRPGGSSHALAYGQDWNTVEATGSATTSYQGTWHLQVSRHLTTGTGGGYSVSMAEMPDTVSYPARSGGSLTPGVTLSGTITLGSFDIYTIQSVAGSNFTVTLTNNGGGTSYPFARLINTSGTTASTATTNTSTTMTVGGANGTFVVYVEKNFYDTVVVPYSISVSGAGSAPPNQAKAKGCSNQPSLGRYETKMPINIATGNMCESVTDYTTVGQNSLAFIRTYNSMNFSDNIYASALGPNWRHNYDRYIRAVSSTQTTAERPDGQVINFTKPSSTWVPDADMDYTLTKSGSTWTLTTPDDVVETYTETGGKGTLDSIVWPNGYTQTLAYSSGKLSTVTDSYSRVLTLTYTSAKLTGVSTPDSATLTYGYTTVSSKDLLTSVAYNTSPGTSQTYVYANSNLPFALTSITDENGNTNAQWTYDGAGRALSEQHAGGADLTSVAYDDTNGQRTVTGPLNEALTYSFTSDHNLQKVSSIARAAASPVASATRYFTYDGNGFLATSTDWNGNSTHYTNNSHGKSTSITEAYGTGLARTTTISYDANCPRKPEVITRTNLIITNNWDNTTCVLLTRTEEDDTGGSTDGQTHVWTWTYNGTGQVLTTQRPRTGTTVKNTYTYSGGKLATVTDQLSHVWTINTANGTGQPTQITDPNGVVTDLTYDNRNRLLTKTVNASTDEVTTYTYTGSGQINLITFADSSTLDYDYDNAQRLTKITNTAGETINYTLNAMGKPTTTTIKDSGGNTKKSNTATYDVLGNMLTYVGSGGVNETTSFSYDGESNPTSVTDPNSKTTSTAWDALNRASTVTDPLTHTAAPTYNNLDYVTAQTDFLGYSTSYTRDGFGNAIARSSPDTGSWSFTYNEDNRLTAVTDARSVAKSLTYDAVDRFTAMSITGYSGEAETYTYDDTTGGNKGISRLTSWTDESGSGSRVYDNFGNITSETRVINSKTYTTTYAYDLANRITQIIYPSGRYVTYTYDSSGYLTTVTTKPSAGGGVTTLASSIVHKPFGPIASFTFGNSEAHTRTYSNNYWLTDIDTVYSGTYVQRLDFAYDYAGNLTSITDNINSARNETYTVDDLNRLHTASGDYGSLTYTYDNNSGRATRVKGATTWTTTRVSSKNRVDHISDGTNQRDFTWTANGNMATDDRDGIGGGALANTYGGRDRLESMTVGANTVTFKVNAFDQRVSKAFSGTTTHYIHDVRGLIIAEANGSSGATTTEYVWMEGELLAQIDSGGNIVYVHNNQLGAPQKITNPSRTLVWDREQEPFGETYATPTNTTPTTHRFPGQIYDSENGLYYNNNRDYDPTGGFYIEADPIGLAGGLTPYGYAGQNPTQATDPWGLSDCKNNCGVKSAGYFNPDDGEVSGQLIEVPKTQGNYEFDMRAHFMNDATHSPDCCEVREYSRWTDEAPHSGFPNFNVPGYYVPGHWYEDRYFNGGFYGHNDPKHPENDQDRLALGYQLDAFHAHDKPDVFPGSMLEFRMQVVDTCNGGAKVFNSDSLTLVSPK
jgi:RHS repeat-associated protein